jgi:hypothetical protein
MPPSPMPCRRASPPPYHRLANSPFAISHIINRLKNGMFRDVNSNSPSIRSSPRARASRVWHVKMPQSEPLSCCGESWVCRQYLAVLRGPVRSALTELKASSHPSKSNGLPFFTVCSASRYLRTTWLRQRNDPETLRPRPQPRQLDRKPKSATPNTRIRLTSKYRSLIPPKSPIES